MGHIRDLPSSADEIPEAYREAKWAKDLGINVEAGFEPLYVIPKEKKKTVQELKTALKEATELILATDEDREGESISWHLLEVLKPKVPTKRMVFHEITKDAIQKALRDCRQVDDKLVQAQETRRILDRLVGYTVSPLLWKKIAFGLSAGRVQSVAVKTIVCRERERRAFKSAEYWDLKALLFKDGEFEAKLVLVDGVKVATSSDFDPMTGLLLPGKQVKLLNEEEAKALVAALKDELWQVAKVESKPLTRKPSPPFTTSTLQQEANRKLRLSAKETMRVAQNLYERGFITYMRTDSVHLSEQAIVAARTCVESMYGSQYLSPKPRQYATKAKGAQEAHEAIRPAGSSFRTPQETGLSDREFALYDLIWKRTVASQMADSRQTQSIVDIQVQNAGFRATGKTIDFPGFLRAYVEGSDDPEAALEEREVILPALQVGDRPECKKLTALQHITQPPPRYSEAALVKMLESEGIGRPSTYASIIGTIVDRNYALLQNNALIPTFRAFAVTALLEQHFGNLVDNGFTAQMERTLDEIAEGKASWLPYLKEFYLGDRGLEAKVKSGEKDIDGSAAKTVVLEGLSVKVRIGKFGPYIEGDGVNASIPNDLTPADLDEETIAQLLKQKSGNADSLGIHPEKNEPIYVKLGPYGPYVQLGDKTDENPKPKNTSLPKGMQMEDVTLEIAVGLLSLPRLLGEHPDGGKIKASLGRFGPYVEHDRGKEDGKEYRSLKSTDNVTAITLERAIELLAEPKVGRGGARSKTKEPLKILGQHPTSGEQIAIFKGPYGIYVNHQKVNAGLPEGETPESMDLEKALSLLAAKGDAAPKKTTKKASSATKSAKSTTKSTSKSTTTAKKKTPPKSTSK
jgi:DNA topoisomerase-1